MAMRHAVATLIAMALCVAAYLAGVYQGVENDWPVPGMKMLLKAELSGGMLRTDVFGRLLRYPGKTEIPCPPQDARTAVLLVFGQSNTANYQGQRYAGIDDRVVNLSEGKCYRAASPLLGADGRLGESWTLLGNKLIASGLFDRVILIPAGVGSSPVHRWARGGDLNRMLLAVVSDARQRYAVTDVLWQQGATDFAMRTPEDDYRSNVRSLVEVLRSEGVAAPFYICRASYQQTADWTADNPVTRAQASLVDGTSILAGPDTDRDITDLDRFDGLHFSATGQEKFADAWLRLLRARHAPNP